MTFLPGHPFSPMQIELRELTARMQATLLRVIRRGIPAVNVGEWQGIKGGETAKTYEVTNVSFTSKIPDNTYELIRDLRPNMPWAEDHFGERVGGEPVNPPPSSKHWPFTQRGHAEHVDESGQFSHSYPERLWPQYTPSDRGVGTKSNFGIRYRFGDLEDVVAQLANSLHTRQAYIPIWFPEDTGAVSGQRVPCTLGYHVLVRNGRMQLTYYIRSCDLLRHFTDDVYMAMRLCQWLCLRVNERLTSLGIESIQPGEFHMHIVSLHVFEADAPSLELQYKQGQRIAATIANG